MPFPANDSFWTEVLAFLKQHAKPLDAILAPNEFLEFFPGTYYYNVASALPPEHFKFVVFHKGMVAELDPLLALKVLHQFHPVFANDVFVVYAQAEILDTSIPTGNDLQALTEQFEAAHLRILELRSTKQTTAAVITTYNRPWCLERSLTRILELGIPVVVVDDASDSEHVQANQQITEKRKVPLLRLPSRRQQASAINAGVEYWLADPNISWISVFQDDVEVKSDLLAVLGKVQDAKEYPILTGFDAIEHPAVQTKSLDGQKVLLKRSTSGVHLHAHRDYWAAVLPIPTPYQASDKNGDKVSDRNTDADWWITAWAPESIVKRGGFVACVPDLISQINTAPPTHKAALQIPQPEDRASQASDQLSLEGVKVLIDGYNLQLTKGTGIKTYGLSLIQALDTLNAKVDVLLSRNGYRANEILDEVIFFDNQSSDQSLLNVAKWIIKTSLPFYRAKRRKPPTGFVVKRGQYSDDFLRYTTSFNLPQCYDFANALYNKLRLKTTVRLPEKVDIWHATYPLPITIPGASKITTIHDLIPLRLPYATLDDKETFYYKTRDTLKDSQVIVTVSENSKQDLLRYFDVDPDRIVVTYQPIALKPLEASEEDIADILKRYGLQPQKYLLFIGAIEPKKNVGRLLDAYASLDTDMTLVVAGKKGWLWEDELGRAAFFLDNKESKKKVKLLEYVPTDLLRYLYRGAYCFVFPSLYEGFGLPPIEAMHFGCPVITSNASCLPEICGDAALYVDPYDAKDIQQKLELLLSDTELREQLIQTGYQVVEKFSMENYRRRLYRAYTQALG
ncbi:MAG: hypothetical protein Kow00121_22220 [Elainellaceae cyanobacterium]